MTKKRSVQQFNKQHEFRYGVGIASRAPTGSVIGVKCMLCVTFGRENQIGSGRVSKTNRRVNACQIFNSFRPDYYLRYHRDYHSVKWNEYEASENKNKISFFESKLPFANRLDNYFGRASSVVYKIHSKSVDGLVIKYFGDQSILNVNFLKKHSQTDINLFSMLVPNLTHFDLIVSYISSGLSFRQASLSAQPARMITGTADLCGITEAVVRKSVSFTVLINLQHLRSFITIKSCWAYSVAFDTATNRGDDYLDLRVRLFAKGRLHNYHVLALPFTDKHSVEAMFKIVKDVCQSLFGDNWMVKMLSAATDGASNMTGRFQGAVTRLEQVAAAGFFRIWCMAHQLDLIVKSLMTDTLQKLFYEPMLSFISFLRRQSNLTNQMGAKCPTVCSTRWHSLGSALRWLINHRTEIVDYGKMRNSPTVPSRCWWVLAEALKSFMSPVDVCFRAIQGRHTLLIEQNTRLQDLISSIRDDIKMDGPLLGADVLIAAASEDVVGTIDTSSGVYIARDYSIIEFIEKCGSAPEKDISLLSESDRQMCVKCIATFYCEAINRIEELKAERSSANGPATISYTSIIPSELIKLQPREFNQELRRQKERLLSTFSSDMIVKIEDDFKQFKRHVQGSVASQQALKTETADFSFHRSQFEEAWDLFK